MGQCLRDAYEERDLAIALAKVHGLIDEDTRKLSDKLHDLELSHNRYRKLLKMTMKFIESCFDGNYTEWQKDAQYLHRRIFGEFRDMDEYKGLKGGV